MGLHLPDGRWNQPRGGGRPAWRTPRSDAASEANIATIPVSTLPSVTIRRAGLRGVRDDQVTTRGRPVSLGVPARGQPEARWLPDRGEDRCADEVAESHRIASCERTLAHASAMIAGRCWGLAWSRCELMSDLPPWVHRWCREFLAATPVAVLFLAGHVSEEWSVFGSLMDAKSSSNAGSMSQGGQAAALPHRDCSRSKAFPVRCR